MAIENNEDFRLWLDGQRPSTGQLIAARAAIRVFPIATSTTSDGPTDLTALKQLVLLTARAVLTAGVAAKIGGFTSSQVTYAASAFNSSYAANSVVQSAAKAARFAVYSGHPNPGHEIVTTVLETVNFAENAFTDAVISASPNSAHDPIVAGVGGQGLQSKGGASSSIFQEEVFSDCKLELDSMFTSPVWKHQVEPDLLATICPKDARLINQGREWAFWREWYQGYLTGNHVDWELQRRVALIPDADWEKGPEHIAKLIEEIRARFELEKRLEVLEAEKQIWEERARLGVGGNNPPEPLEDDRIVQEIIWAPIEELKVETQADAPDKSRIKSAVSKLAAALIVIGKWPLGKLDKAADEFARSLGKWAGRACAGWLAFNSDKIADVIEAALNWLATLG